MAAIAQVAGRLGTVTVARVGYTLSRETRERVEADAVSQAVARISARAGGLGQPLGVKRHPVGGGVRSGVPANPAGVNQMSYTRDVELIESLSKK